MKMLEDRASAEGLLSLSEEEMRSVRRSVPISEVYDVEDIVFARGKFATVRRASHKTTGVQYAAKYIKKRRRAVDMTPEIYHEICVLLKCASNSRVVRLHEVYESNSDMVLVLELAAGGELQRIFDGDQCLGEIEARRSMRQILDGLCFLHERNIAHLDLKPQNLLLTTEDCCDDIKLCDFGVSRLLAPGTEVRAILGTPDYVAPEVLSYEPISLATDIWSVGVLAYVLLSGYTPFGADSKQQTYLNISKAIVTFEPDHFVDVSNAALDFIKSILVVNPRQRPTVQDLLQHPWISQKSHILPTLTLKSSESISVTPKSTPISQRKTLPCSDAPSNNRSAYSTENMNGFKEHIVYIRREYKVRSEITCDSMSPIDETASAENDKEKLDSATCDDESGLSDDKTLPNGTTDCEIDGEIKCESSETSSVMQAENEEAIGVEETASYELQLREEERENLSQHVICLGEYKFDDGVVNTNKSEAVNGEELKSQFQEEIHLNHSNCTAEGECDKHHEVVNEALEEEEVQNTGVGTKPKGDVGNNSGVATANDDDFKPQFFEEIQPNHTNCAAKTECDHEVVEETSRETQLDEGVQGVGQVEAMVTEDCKKLEDAVVNGDDLKPQLPEETQLNHENCAEIVQEVEFETDDCKNLEFDLIPQHHEITCVFGETNLEEAKETAFLAKSTNYKGDEEVGEATDLDNDVSRESELNEAEKTETERKIIKNDDSTGVANGCHVVPNDLITW